VVSIYNLAKVPSRASQKPEIRRKIGANKMKVCRRDATGDKGPANQYEKPETTANSIPKALIWLGFNPASNANFASNSIYD